MLTISSPRHSLYKFKYGLPSKRGLPRQYLFCGSFVFFVPCVSHAFAPVHCCLLVSCWERADLLAHVGDVYCIFVTFLSGILGQVWYLIVSFPDLCCLSYFFIFRVCLATRGVEGSIIKVWERIQFVKPSCLERDL